MDVSLGAVFLSELVGTAILVLLGCGTVANVSLAKSKGHGTGWTLVSFGFGFGLFAGVIVGAASGGHLNPAVTLAKLIAGDGQFAEGIDISVGSFFTYISAQLIGAFIGAVLIWLVYRKQFDATDDPATQLGVFATGPSIRSYGWNTVTETIATFMLIFGILCLPSGMNLFQIALSAGFIMFAVGAGLGGPTGFALNPARDLGPRIAHAILPMKNKGGSDWSYAWVPIVGPLLGGLLAGCAALGMNSAGVLGIITGA